jgi:hypothetical protein
MQYPKAAGENATKKKEGLGGRKIGEEEKREGNRKGFCVVLV